MTLIELLVSVLVIGGMVTVLSAAVAVTLRQQPETQERIDVARWEQSLAMWLPADLTSAGDVDVDPEAAPCGSAECEFGSNALELVWNDEPGTVVSYRYGPHDDGSSYMLTRVECKAGLGCTSQVVLRDLAPPPPPWVSGDPVPDSVIDVTVPLIVDSPDAEDPSAPAQSRRVIVTVNGVPTADGVDRSSTVSFTAGGTARGDLPIPSFNGPEFLQAATGCGGPVTLIVDESSSILDVPGAAASVQAGVRSFVRTFEGTPTRLQIITFGGEAATLGTSGWNQFFDLSEPADVDALIGPSGGLVSSIWPFPRSSTSHLGGTNWEDALFRAFFASDGQTYTELASPAAPPSELVVFFTDGVPTFDRTQHRATPSAVAAAITPPAPYTTHYTASSPWAGTSFSARGWLRTDRIVDRFRNPDVRLIGVGVGAAASGSTSVGWSGWPSSVPNEVFLGRLVSGTNDPHTYTSGGALGYTKVTYDGGWGDVTSADLLLTTDFDQFGSALTQIALAECGGTLTVQTRDQANQPADAIVRYEADGRYVETSPISKSGTFQIDLDGVPSRTIELIPSLDGTGVAADEWSCRAGGSSYPFDLLQAGNPAAGIEIDVQANAAVSCTLQVTP